MNRIKLHPAITFQLRNAEMKVVQINAVADHLAALMAEAHGKEWKVDVSHEDGAEFILIRPKLKRERADR